MSEVVADLGVDPDVNQIRCAVPHPGACAIQYLVDISLQDRWPILQPGPLVRPRPRTALVRVRPRGSYRRGPGNRAERVEEAGMRLVGDVLVKSLRFEKPANKRVRFRTNPYHGAPRAASARRHPTVDPLPFRRMWLMQLCSIRLARPTSAEPNSREQSRRVRRHDEPPANAPRRERLAVSPNRSDLAFTSCLIATNMAAASRIAITSFVPRLSLTGPRPQQRAPL